VLYVLYQGTICCAVLCDLGIFQFSGIGCLILLQKKFNKFGLLSGKMS